VYTRLYILLKEARSYYFLCVGEPTIFFGKFNFFSFLYQEKVAALIKNIAAPCLNEVRIFLERESLTVAIRIKIAFKSRKGHTMRLQEPDFCYSDYSYTIASCQRPALC
jgi:hypothetical protein